MNALLSRLGRSLRRAPYVWGALTFVAWLYMLSALSPLVEDERNAKTWIAVVAACLIAYSLIVALVLWPRLVIGRAKLPTSDDQIAVIRWTFATTPFLVGLGSVAVGGKQWAAALGLAASTVQVVLAARQIRRDARPA